MYKTLPIVFAAGALAQSTITTTWLAFGFENTPVASVIGADANAVTYSIGCVQSDIDDGDCGLAGGFTITQGPAVFEFQYTDNAAASGYTADFSESASCSIDGTTMAVCVESAAGSEANFPGITTETITGTDMSFGTLLITAGFDKLSATAGGSASGTHASATGSSSSASETGSSAQSGSRTSAGASVTGSATSSTATASKSGSASGSAASATSTGGAAQFAVPIAGVAGVLAAALAL